MSKLHICFSADNKRINMCKRSIYDIIIRKKPETEIEFYILVFKDDISDISDFLKFNTIDKIKVHIVEFSKRATEELKSIGKRQHMPSAFYLRLSIPNLCILRNVDRVLYMDSDTLALKDLTSLYQTDLEGKMLGIAPHALRIVHGYMLRTTLGYGDKSRFFNTGVMLMDLNKLREVQFEETCMRRLSIESNYLDTETLIAHTFFDDIKPLPPTANLLYPLIEKNYPHMRDIFYWNLMYHTRYKSITELLEDTYILHFFEESNNPIPPIKKIYNESEKRLVDFLNTEIINTNVEKSDYEIIHKYI